MTRKHTPPRLAQRFLRWYCREALLDEVEGDLQELFERRVRGQGLWKARLLYYLNVLMFLHPDYIRRRKKNYTNNTIMFKNYLIIGWRNMARQKMYSLIKVGGLALGMSVGILISLWILDEINYNRYHDKHERIAAVMQNMTFQGEIETMSSQSYQLAEELRNNYGNYFKNVVMSTFTSEPVLSIGEKSVSKSGYFAEPEIAEMLSLRLVSGNVGALQDPKTMLIASSTAKALFGNEDPLGKAVEIDRKYELQVGGVYEDIPQNSSFADMLFVAPIEPLVSSTNQNLGWINNWLEVYVELEDQVNMDAASLAIRDVKKDIVNQDLAAYNPQMFLHPLSNWRLYSDFDNGVNTGGYIELVWLFGAIGIFVLLLACINFMNLSTARSEKRAKEVGIRKVMGSLRRQLMQQFYSETLLVVGLAFLLSLIIVQLALPWFNDISAKQISLPMSQWLFWALCLGIIFLTALVSGSYPALYLSAFSPGKVLKKMHLNGRNGSLPRKVLVVFQFSVSLILAIGTILVYQQIQHAKDRPLGYEHEALLMLPVKTQEAKDNYKALRNALLSNGLASNIARSETKVTDMYWSDFSLDWPGRDPEMQVNVYRGAVDFEFGETINWEIIAGRDFSRALASDSSAMILNEAAVDYMKLDDPIGTSVKLHGIDYTVIGVVADMISQSLYGQVEQTYFVIDRYDREQFINIRLNEQRSISTALAEIEQVFKSINPSTPFEYSFADTYLANKVAFEVQIGRLAGIFALFAILISCLGLFGLASYVAEQRVKEIGIRKVLGASVAQLWRLLSKDFVLLVSISLVVAIPLAYYLLKIWLQNYQYRIEISWWVFVLSGFAALLLTLMTVSFQTIKAALANPVNSLRSE